MIYGFTTRLHGDMRDAIVRTTFIYNLDQANAPVVVPQQIHGNIVRIVRDSKDQVVVGADGLVYRKIDNKPIFLAVRVADCVPVVAFDEKTGVIGVAHAGWKGTLGDIAGKLVAAMKEAGAHGKEIRVIMGPAIGPCCYNVSSKRASAFRQEMGDSVVEEEGAYMLNLALANTMFFQKAGIPKDNISVSDKCTSCNVDTYFSFRRDTKETFGEIMGYIGYIV